MASQKPNGTYLVRLRTSDGRVSRVFPTLNEAEAWERTAKDAIKRGMPIPANSKHETTLACDFFHASVRYLWPDSNNSNNLFAQAAALVKFFGSDRDVSTITTRDAVEFKTHMMKQGRAGSTINNYAAVFNRIMEHAHKLGLNADKPVMDYSKQRKGKVRYLSETEEQSLIAYFEYIGRNDYADLVTVLIYVGARINDILPVKWSDITERSITVWDSKTGNPRMVPLTKKAKAALQRRRDEHSFKPFNMGYQTFKTAFDKATAKLHMDDVTPHTLRHTCASRLVQGGVDIRRVKDWLGHASIQTTMIYAHLAPEDLFSAVNVLEGDQPVTRLVTGDQHA